MKPCSHEKRSKVPTASGIPVYCGFTKIVPAADQKRHPKNPKNHPPRQLDRYEKVVSGNGWRRCAVVSDLSGCVTKGNGAVQMAARRGWEIPIEVQHYASEHEELCDILADNKLAELAETNEEKLAAILAELGGDEIDLTGFDASEVERLLQETVVVEGEFPITAKLGEGYDYILIFTTNDTEFVFLQTLFGIRQERSYKKTGVGLGRAIPLARALKALHENRHSLDVQSGHDDHSPADSKRPRVRPEKPARRISKSRRS